jgi:hypothetical protein
MLDRRAIAKMLPSIQPNAIQGVAMKPSHIRKHVICGTAAALLTGITFSIFVAAEPQTYERSATPHAATAQVVVSEGAPSYLAVMQARLPG